MRRANRIRSTFLIAIAVLICACERIPDWDRVAPLALRSVTGVSQLTGHDETRDTNIVENGSFEDATVAPWSGLPPRGVSLDLEVRIDGSKSLRIDRAAANGYIELFQEFDKDAPGFYPLGRYRLSAKLKCTNTTAPAYIKIITGKYARSVIVGEIGRSYVLGTQDWTSITIDFTVAAEAAMFRVLLCCDAPVPPNQSTGTLWIDAVRLEQVPRA